MIDYKTRIKAIEVSEEMDYDKWIQEIPYISFPPEWEIKITPPFGGAVVRFAIKHKNAYVSVYLDCYDMLGLFGEPYWEIYPYFEDVCRVKMKNISELLNEIEISLKEQNKTKGENNET